MTTTEKGRIDEATRTEDSVEVGDATAIVEEVPVQEETEFPGTICLRCGNPAEGTKFCAACTRVYGCV